MKTLPIQKRSYRAHKPVVSMDAVARLQNLNIPQKECLTLKNVE